MTTNTEVQRTAPARIFLLVSDDPKHSAQPFPKDPDGDEVTWCKDKALDCAVEYVRADLCMNQHFEFQQRVEPWMLACFGAQISADTVERNHRFLEEALELVQACGCTQSEAHQLVDYVYGRPVGEKVQEVGGVMVTLAALCLAQGIDMYRAGNIELSRIWGKVEAIRAKQAAKPKHSPLPGPSDAGGAHAL